MCFQYMNVLEMNTLQAKKFLACKFLTTFSADYTDFAVFADFIITILPRTALIRVISVITKIRDK